MGSPEDTGARGRPRARSSARPDRARHLGAPVTLRERVRAFGRSGAGALAVAGAVLVLGLVGAVFSSTTQNPPNVYTAAALDAYVPTAVTATRTSTTTCLVSWTPVSSPPTGMTYDVTNGSGTTVVTGASGTSATATVPVTAVTPTVKARLGSWVSTAATAASAPCNGWPDAPGSLTLTPSDGAVSASWTAPAGNGGTVASYTATISPAPGSGSATCTTTVPTTSCSWSSLTNGLTYTVSVTATSNVGTGPAATATAIPYPSTVMTSSALKLWLDGADPSTILASSGCTGATATTAVGCWKDKSTSANNATQATGGSQPSLATVSSRSVPSFDGSASYLALTPTSLPNGTTASSTFIALRTTEANPASSDWRTALSWGSGANGQTRSYQKNTFSAATGAVAWGGTLSSGGSIIANTTGVLSDTWTSSAYTGYWNGAAGSTVTVGTSTGTTAAYVGAQLSVAGYWMGPIPEVVVVQGTLTTSQRRAVEEYLSRKWSVTITPGQPTGVTATPSTTADGTASVAWTAPSYDGGSSITSYTVTGTPSDGTLPTVSLSCASSPCTVSGFVDGALYSVTVTANNAVGAGPASSAASLTTYPAGSVMTSSALKLWLDGADSSTLFAGSTCSGTAATTTTGCWKDKSSSANDVSQPTAGSRPSLTTVNGRSALSFDGSAGYLSGNAALMPNGTTTGTLAVASAVTPATLSGGAAVVSYGGTGNYTQRRLMSWGLASADTLGSQTAQTTAWPGGTAQSVTVATWTGGASYSIWNRGTTGVTASDTNSTGTHHLWVGAWGASSPGQFWAGNIPEVIGLNGSLTSAQRRTVEEYLARKWGGVITPAAPTAVTATASTTADGTASVAWSAPAWNGGSAVTGYTVTAVPSDGTLSTVTQSCASSPCTVSGLTNGATYAVTVTATNGVGSGPASSSATVIPYPAGTVMTSSALQLWLDGADGATLFSGSGCTGTATTTVACWKDKSSQQNNAVQTLGTTYTPTLTSFGGRSVPGYNGSSSFLSLTLAKLPTGGNTSTTAVVAKQTGTPAYRNLVSWGSANAGAARAFYTYSDSTIVADTYLATPRATAPSLGAQNSQFQATATWTSTTAALTANGLPQSTSSPGTVATTTNGTNPGAVVGGVPLNSYWFTGPIGEVLVLNTTLSQTQQRTLDEYLARKWGTVIAPNAPTSATATASTTTDGAADVSWSASSGWNGGAAVTSYTVTATPADATAATVTKSCASSPCTVTGLTNGALYTVTVQAVNSAGSSWATTAASTVTPYPAATFTANTLALWLDGADPSMLFSNTACTTAAGTSTGSAVACWKDKSANARNAVAAANATVGSTLNSRATVAFSGTSQLAAPRPASGDMTIFAVPRTSQANQGTVTDQWWMGATVFDADNPGGSSDFGMTITGGTAAFGAGAADATAHGAATLNNGAGHVMVGRRVMSSGLLEVSSDGRSRGTATGPTTSLTGPTSVYLGKHPNTTTYVGDIGEVVTLGAAASRTDERTVVEYLSRKWGFSITPSAPSGVTVTGADSQATVAWTAPWNGYSAITGYTITATPVDGTLSTLTKACSSSPCTVTGMTNGATYAFTITATNAIGTGPASTAVNASAYPATLFAAADLKLWLDAQYDGALSAASDCSGSGATTGTVVGCWRDRSGNGWDAPKVTTSGATLTAGAINSRQALRFSKTDPDVYQATAAGLGAVGSADRSLFAVAAARTTYGTSGANNAGAVAMFNSGWNTGIFAKAYSGTTTTVDAYQLDGYNTGIVGAYAGVTATTSPTVLSAISSSSGGTLTNALSLNGTGTPTTGSVAGTWQTVGSSFVVGGTDVVASNAYAYPLDGDVGEVLLFDRALSASERRTVEEYLARHWGQTIAPSAPTLSTVTKPASGQLTATWSAPTGWNGGAAVTSYTATATASGQTSRTCSTASTSCTISGLTAGVTYSVTVAAVNSVGAGANSNAVSGTP